jgi:hypothetical protein
MASKCNGYLGEEQLDLTTDDSPIFSSQKSNMDYVTLQGIENRTGVDKDNVYGFVLKELLDNAVDFLETQRSGSNEIKVTISLEQNYLRFKVRNSNSSYDRPVFSKDMLESIFNIDKFYSSKRNQYRIKRGALGDAFKEILCVPYALARDNGNMDWNEPLIIRTRGIGANGQAFHITLEIDRVKQIIQPKINEILTQQQGDNFTEIEVRLPLLDKQSILTILQEFLLDYTVFNTHVSFTFDLPSALDIESRYTFRFPQVQPIDTKWTGMSSIYYYTLPEFQNFVLSLDSSSSDSSIYNVLQKTFREGSNMKRTELTSITVSEIKQQPQTIPQIYEEMHKTMQPIPSPSNLSLPFDTNRKMRIEAIKERLMQRGLKVSDIKYKSKYGYYCHDQQGVMFPFFFEIAVVYSDDIKYNLDYIEALNSSVMPSRYSFLIGSNTDTFYWQTQSDKKNGGTHSSNSIFDIFAHYGYSHEKDKCRKPHSLILVNLVSPIIEYKSYGKSNIDLEPFADVIAQTTVRACSGGSGSSNENDEGKPQTAKGLLIELLRLRLADIEREPLLKITDRWTQSTVYYRLRPIAISKGVKIERQYITSQIKEVCEKVFNKKREDFGIIAADRAQLYFRRQWHDVGLDELNSLKNFGTDLLIIEKEGVTQVLAPFADKNGIALLNTRGFLTEYATRLSELSKDSGCNVAILTDFDVSGLLLATKVSYVYRIGIDFDTLQYLGIEAKEVEETYNPDNNHTVPLKGRAQYNHDLKISLEYITEKRIEIDSVLARVGNKALWGFVIRMLTKRFPTRNYNRAINVPDYVIPTELEKLNELIKKKGTAVLQSKCEQIKSQHLANVQGIIDDIDLKEKEVSDTLSKTIEENKDIQLILSEIKRLEVRCSNSLQ